MYAKIFRQIYDSSIAENPQVRFTFMDLLVLADSDGVVDMTHEAISRVTNRSLPEIKETIAVLEGPDPQSRTKDHDGARIARLDDHRDWGWVILNYDRFRQYATEEQRRVSTRERVRKHRATRSLPKQLEPCNAPVTQCNAPVTPLYASACASSSDQGNRGEGEKGFPVTVDDAIRQCALLPVPQEHVTHCFDKANGRGGVDAKGLPIAKFASYVMTEWKYERERRAKEKKGMPRPGSGNY